MKNQNKIYEIITSTENKQHEFILALLFKLKLSTGQIINLQVRDIRNNILYSRGKRIYITDSMMHDFYIYTQNKTPSSYLLYSNRNKKYSIRSIQEIKKKALKKAKLPTKKATKPHKRNPTNAYKPPNSPSTHHLPS